MTPNLLQVSYWVPPPPSEDAAGASDEERCLPPRDATRLQVHSQPHADTTVRYSLNGLQPETMYKVT